MPLGEAAANGPLGRWPEFLSGSVSNFIEQRASFELGRVGPVKSDSRGGADVCRFPCNVAF